MLLPRRADSVNYFLLGSAAIICIFHLAVIDVAGGREEDERDRNTFHFVPQLSGEKKKKIHGRYVVTWGVWGLSF